jgi:hypothetical protein
MKHPIVEVGVIPEIVVPGKRLGRAIEHDPRSKAFGVTHQDPIVSKVWIRHVPAFDQKSLGACTGFSMAGVIMTDPFRPSHLLTEADAVELYQMATHLDRIPGAYPPNDTGSSGLAVARAAVKLGYIQGYHHAFSLQSALHALMRGPVITGLNWYSSFDDPVGVDHELVISPNAEVRGGHEIEVLGVDAEARTIRLCNSWGTGWGEGGYATMKWTTWERLLEEQGDVTVPSR